MPDLLLQVPDEDGFSFTFGSQVVRQQLDGGEGMYRTDKAGASGRARVRWYLNPDQYEYWSAFYEEKTKLGALGFYCHLVSSRPGPPRRHLCYFIPGSINVTVRGLQYTVQAELEVRPEKFNATEAQGIVNAFAEQSGVRLDLRFDQGLISDYSPFSFLDQGGGAVGDPAPAVVFDEDYGQLVYDQLNNNNYLAIPFNITGVVGDTTSYSVALFYKGALPAGTRVLFSTATSNALQLLVSNSAISAGHGAVDVAGGNGFNNIWTMAGLTWNKDNGEMFLYQNGNVVDFATSVAGYNTTSLSFRAMGRDGSTEGFVGRMSRLLFVNYVMTASEMQSFYTQNSP